MTRERSYLAGRRARVVALLVLFRAAAAAAQPAESRETPPAQNAERSDAQDLSAQATDPTASLMSFNFLNEFKLSYHGEEGCRHSGEPDRKGPFGFSEGKVDCATLAIVR